MRADAPPHHSLTAAHVDSTTATSATSAAATPHAMKTLCPCCPAEGGHTNTLCACTVFVHVDTARAMAACAARVAGEATPSPLPSNKFRAGLVHVNLFLFKLRLSSVRVVRVCVRLYE